MDGLDRFRSTAVAGQRSCNEPTFFFYRAERLPQIVIHRRSKESFAIRIAEDGVPVLGEHRLVSATLELVADKRLFVQPLVAQLIVVSVGWYSRQAIGLLSWKSNGH